MKRAAANAGAHAAQRFDGVALRSALAACLPPEPAGLAVAYSGGLDSTVLLHALALLPAAELRALHVNHQMQPAAAQWEQHCAQVCAGLGVPLTTLRVTPGRRGGPEGSAREARYAALMAQLQPGEVLCTAQHEDDQAETLLLALLRGAGTAGLAAMAPLRTLGDGWQARPLLGFNRVALQDYAARHALAWVDDPLNLDTSLPRNELRASVLPALESLQPGAARQLARSASWSRDSLALLGELAVTDLGGKVEALVLARFADLSASRLANALRHLVLSAGWHPPGAAQLAEFVRQLRDAAPDRHPRLRWGEFELRAYRGRVYLRRRQRVPAVWQGELAAGSTLELPAALGTLHWPEAAGEPLQVSFRRGGEHYRGDAGSRRVKQLLQERGVLPWMRGRIPLVRSAGEVVAVAGVWQAPVVAGLRWSGHPELFASD